MRYVVDVPIPLPSLANARMHWRAVARLKKSQRDAVHWACLAADVRPSSPRLPAIVTIWRYGARLLDSDNLVAAGKYVRDAVAFMLGVDDGPREKRVTWRYEQATGKPRVRIVIEATT